MSNELRDDYVGALEAENDELRERVRALEALLGFTLDVPPVFGLTGTESRVLGFLSKRDMVTKEQVLDMLYSDRPNEVPEIKIVDVYVCKIRKKMKQFGIEIDTVWGRGYRIPAASKKIIEQFLQNEVLPA